MEHLDTPKESRRRRILTMLGGGRCKDCGAKDNLLFHHLVPSEKRFHVSDMGRKFTLSVLEAAKCHLVCVPCHRQRHRLMGKGIVPVKNIEAERKRLRAKQRQYEKQLA